MPEHLIFTLTAALAAHGDLAGHERRGTLGWPGRSALLGLLGAALGLERGGDFATLDALHLAVAVFDEGRVLRDYHTVMTVPTAVAKRPQSRPEALRAAGVRTNTTVTLRDYRMAALYGVAVWGGDLGPLLNALERPGFTLYLGRKSCPLAAPLGARIVESVGPAEAMMSLQLPPWRAGWVADRMALDAGDCVDAQYIEERQDQPIDRAAWHFAARHVAWANVRIAPGGAA